MIARQSINSSENVDFLLWSYKVDEIKQLISLSIAAVLLSEMNERMKIEMVTLAEIEARPFATACSLKYFRPFFIIAD